MSYIEARDRKRNMVLVGGIGAGFSYWYTDERHEHHLGYREAPDVDMEEHKNHNPTGWSGRLPGGLKGYVPEGATIDEDAYVKAHGLTPIAHYWLNEASRTPLVDVSYENGGVFAKIGELNRSNLECDFSREPATDDVNRMRAEILRIHDRHSEVQQAYVVGLYDYASVDVRGVYTDVEMAIAACDALSAETSYIVHVEPHALNEAIGEAVPA